MINADCWLEIKHPLEIQFLSLLTLFLCFPKNESNWHLGKAVPGWAYTPAVYSVTFSPECLLRVS